MSVPDSELRPIITLTVDDCWRDHAHAFSEKFDAMSLRGVFYVIAGFVGKEVNGFRFVEWDTLRQMSGDGHEIGSHSFTHRVSPTGMRTKTAQLLRLVRSKGLVHSARRFTNTILNLEEEYPVPHLKDVDEISLSKLEVEKQLGKPCRSYSYPGGQLTSVLKNLVKEKGYSSARTTRLGFNHTTLVQPYSLRSQVWDRWVTAKTANEWVDRAIKKNLWLIEVFHAIDLPDYLYSCSNSALKQHLSYIQKKRDEFDNLTVAEAIEKVQSPIDT